MAKLDFHDIETVRLINKLQDEILELIDDQDEFTRSDLQGVVMAKVMKILKIGHEMAEKN